MKTRLFYILVFSICGEIFAQNITNTLGTGGLFRIKDNTNTFFSLNQSNGTISLISPLAGNQRGSIFKGSDRFLHTYNGVGTDGYNTFLGINAGNFTMGGTVSDQGSYNTGVGYDALKGLTSGSYNSAFGFGSLFSNTTGYENSAFGTYSLYYNTSGYQNSAFGVSLISNTTGSENSAFGFASLTYNTTGSRNSAFGNSSLVNNISGRNNSAFGYRSLENNISGMGNTAVGYYALGSSTGNYNTALGDSAGINITSGSNNIAIGYNAQVPLPTASNQVRIGNTSITYAGIQVAWTVTSDRRYKDNIATIGLGLGFISKLNPVSYVRKNDEKGRTEYGLIAQEVEEVLKSEGIENHAMLTVTDEGMYELRYNDLIAPMIKAIQELKEISDNKDTEIAKLKEENQKKDAKITELELQLNEMKDLKEKVALLEKVLNELKGDQNNFKDVKLGKK